MIATHPEHGSDRLEVGLVERARTRFDVPIAHVVVDAGRDTARLVDGGTPPPPRRPASATPRATSGSRPARVLVIAGTFVSFLLHSRTRPAG
ncbi:hypothetical protein [Miltoncostaea marina]|uniref:hypothetical protein n=1 Tax=Miltoncostaea marina TaxID=2843215 RepID=UPI001C3E860D|nr:hypothetical protein [Miltoncostaea marina]